MILPEDIMLLKNIHPDAETIVHPECRPEVIDLADNVFSTGGMVTHIKRSKISKFIIGTEIGMLHRLKKENPDKEFYPASSYAVCPSMKMNSLSNIITALEENRYVVTIPESIREQAKKSLDRMLESGRGG
jgi:quinolinate synthase